MAATTKNIVARFVANKSGVVVRFEVDMTTGEVSRYGSVYRTTLHTDAARRLFLAGVGIVNTEDVAAFIAGCNRAAGMKTLTTDAARLDRAWRLAGLPMVGPVADVPSAGLHASNCKCPLCAVAHVGCRRFYCPACG